MQIGISSSDARDAARLALQSAVAAVALFVGMRALDMPEKFVGVLSAVLVVQPSVGSTLGEAWNRVAATLVGSLVGVICLALLPGGYGTAVALAVSMLVMNAAAGLRPEWRYGVVAAVALSLRSETDAVDTAQNRALAIGLGALVGTIASLVVWPDTARRRADRYVRSALEAVADRLRAAIERARGQREDDASDARDSFHDNLDRARQAAGAIRLGDAGAAKERVDRVERLYNSVLILNRVSEETDRAGEGDPEFREYVATIRSRAVELTEQLADDEPDASKLDDIESALGAAREAVGEVSLEPRDQVLRDALVFGLGEVRDSLVALLERDGEDGRGASDDD